MLVILWLYTDNILDSTKSKLLSVYYQFIVSLFCIVSVMSVCCQFVFQNYVLLLFFILAVLYTQVPTVPPPNRWPGCIYDLPLYDTLYIINLQCTFSVGVMVSSLIQISKRSATINKPKGAVKRVTPGRETCLFTATLRLQISRLYFCIIYLVDL